MKMKAFGESETGRKGRNKDVYYIDPENRFFIVADGLGDLGGERSEKAVEYVSAGLDQLLSNPVSIQDVETSLQFLLERINSTLCKENRDYVSTLNPRKQHRYVKEEVGGTTLEALVYVENQQQWVLAHVGDSKTVGITMRGDYEDLSIEQSPWKRQAIDQNLTEEEQFTNASRHFLECFLGSVDVIENDDEKSIDMVDGKLKVETDIFPADRYQYLLMASDGVFDYATQREIREIVTTAPLETVTQRLIERAHNPQEVRDFFRRKYEGDERYSDDILLAADDATAIIIKPEPVKEVKKPREPYERKVAEPRKLSLDWDIITGEEERRQLIISRFFDSLMDSYNAVSGDTKEHILAPEMYRDIFEDGDLQRGALVFEYWLDFGLNFNTLCNVLQKAGVRNIDDYLSKLPPIMPLPGAKATEELTDYMNRVQEIGEIMDKKVEQGMQLFCAKVIEVPQTVGEQRDPDTYHNALKQISELENIAGVFTGVFDSMYVERGVTSQLDNAKGELKDLKIRYFSEYGKCFGFNSDFGKKQPNNEGSHIPIGVPKQRDIDDPVVMEPEDIIRPEETTPQAASRTASYERAKALRVEKSYSDSIAEYQAFIHQERNARRRNTPSFANAVTGLVWCYLDIDTLESLREGQRIQASEIQSMEGTAEQNKEILSAWYFNLANVIAAEGDIVLRRGQKTDAVEKFKEALRFYENAHDISAGGLLAVKAREAREDTVKYIRRLET